MSHSHNSDSSLIWLAGISGVALSAGALAEFTQLLPGNLALPFYLVAYATGGYHGLKETIKDLLEFRINIDFLMIAAAAGAAFLGQWTEGAILLFLFSLSGALEGMALDKSRNAIQSILKLRPSEGLRRNEDGSEELVPIGELKIGDTVIVKPGEHIPIDGEVIEGITTVDQAAITGESIPVTKEKGDEVFAATQNKNGVIAIRVTRHAQDTTVAKIITMVEQAQGSRAKTQRFLDTFEPRYAVGVISAVLLLIIIPWLILGHDFDPVFYRAMTVLVVASPCALIISTPASIISAIANGARNGILFKGGIHVEQAAGIDVIAFDKTGTLTQGEPRVTDMIALDETGDKLIEEGDAVRNLLEIAAGCELHSEHHLADAIVQKSTEMNVEPAPAENVQAVPGRGVRATLNGKSVAVGNNILFEEVIPGWSSRLLEKAQSLRESGKTVVYVTLDEQPVGLIALADRVRPEAKASIRILREMGARKITMLTGDHYGVANVIAEELGIDDVYADLLPGQKADKIEELKKEGTVAMVGDGVNDAPALAVSDLGIAMGAAGTDVALETADIVLMGDDLTRLPYLLWLSRKSGRVVWQNIIFSLAVIVLLLFGVFLVELPLTLGVVAHEGSTLLVVLNGLRLLKGRDLNV